MKRKHHKRILPMVLAAAMVVPAVPAFAEDTTSSLTSSNPTGNVPVELSQAATRFSVSVPTILPVDVDKDGNVTTASDNRIINESWGAVQVKSVSVESLNGWSLKDFETDFGKKAVGVKEYGFQINESNVMTNGVADATTFAAIQGDSEVSFTYDANIGARKNALTNEQIAQVIFTIGWYDDNTVIGGTDMTALSSDFQENTWSQIIYACQNNCVPSSWAIGDTKSMIIDGDKYNIQIIGKDHDIYSDGSGVAPLTFQLVEIYDEHSIMNTQNNNNKWSESYMRNTTLPAILDVMPMEIKSAIKAVNKETRSDTTWWAETNLEITSDRLFLFSKTEIGVGDNYGTAEGKTYEFYSSTVPSKTKRTGKYWRGNIFPYWLRSPYEKSTVYHIQFTGQYSMYGDGASSDIKGTYGYDNSGVTFGFCF